jgi:hypothetical protein
MSVGEALITTTLLSIYLSSRGTALAIATAQALSRPPLAALVGGA